jgi:hypothetical protein
VERDLPQNAGSSEASFSSKQRTYLVPNWFAIFSIAGKQPTAGEACLFKIRLHCPKGCMENIAHSSPHRGQYQGYQESGIDGTSTGPPLPSVFNR